MSKDKKALNENELNSVSGGILASSTAKNINVRENPGLSSAILATVPYGTQFNTTGRTSYADGIQWYEVTLATGSDPGWVAGYLIGLG